MKIGAVSVCLDYSDILAHILPFARPIFDHLIIITDPRDHATKEVCRFFDVQCLATSKLTERGPFCKGAGINVGFNALDKTDWICHFDADIVFPPRTRGILERSDLDPTCIYGADRVMVKSHAEWVAFLANPKPQHEQNIFIHPPNFPLGTRIGKDEHGGWVPLGYMQLANIASGKIHYNEQHTDAARADMLYALQFERRKRILIPEIFLFHLEPEPGLPMGCNWQGRTSPLFGPPPGPIQSTPNPYPSMPVDIKPSRRSWIGWAADKLGHLSRS